MRQMATEPKVAGSNPLACTHENRWKPLHLRWLSSFTGYEYSGRVVKIALVSRPYSSLRATKAGTKVDFSSGLTASESGNKAVVPSATLIQRESPETNCLSLRGPWQAISSAILHAVLIWEQLFVKEHWIANATHDRLMIPNLSCHFSSATGIAQ